MSYCDDGPDVYAESIHTAKKEQRCCECSQPIKAGDTYIACRGRWGGDFSTMKQHERCYEFARHVNYTLDWRENYACIEFGGIDSAVQDCGDNAVIKLWESVCSGFEFRNDPDSKAGKLDKPRRKKDIASSRSNPSNEE